MTNDGKFYSVQLRLVDSFAGDPAARPVEMTAFAQGSGEPHLAHVDGWESLSGRLTTVASSTPFHLKVIHRTLHAGLTAPLIDRATGAPQVFSNHQLAALGLNS